MSRNISLMLCRPGWLLKSKRMLDRLPKEKRRMVHRLLKRRKEEFIFQVLGGLEIHAIRRIRNLSPELVCLEMGKIGLNDRRLPRMEMSKING
jgi:hypothetical protein